MDENLLDHKTSELLKKFGAGSHKPGSGSAAALQGLLSAQLIRTVIELTIDPDRPKSYAVHLSRLTEIKARIGGQIYPALEALLHKDAVQFDKVIRLRTAKKHERDLAKRRLIAAEALTELMPATEIPIEIATHCIELAEFALVIFDNGFRSARGDTGVAMHAAISAVAGCISIIDLNLLSFGSNKWTSGIRTRLSVLKTTLSNLNRESRQREDDLNAESERKNLFSLEIDAIASVEKGKRSLSDADIENLAIRLQRALWKYFDVLGKRATPRTPKEILDPAGALRALDYHVETVPTLGRHFHGSKPAEIAGEIDQDVRAVLISEQFEGSIRNFTMAHELGHALLHEQAVLHRDLPLDGSTRVSDRSERQADRFATHYLMPRKLVTKAFNEMFLSSPFRISEDTAFALTRGASGELRKRCKNKRGLARILAVAESYDGNYFEPLSRYFGVSPEAMAIRLEELNLLEY